tara:strand:+ start:304 stop:534 length:231 start_codon:yes stop_codon:yes gene_type:complete
MVIIFLFFCVGEVDSAVLKELSAADTSKLQPLAVADFEKVFMSSATFVLSLKLNLFFFVLLVDVFALGDFLLSAES